MGMLARAAMIAERRHASRAVRTPSRHARAPDASASADDISHGMPDVAALQAELEEMRGKFMRAVADYQNLRRRSEEERKEYGRYTLAALVINYLPVLDDLDRASLQYALNSSQQVQSAIDLGCGFGSHSRRR